MAVFDVLMGYPTAYPRRPSRNVSFLFKAFPKRVPGRRVWAPENSHRSRVRTHQKFARTLSMSWQSYVDDHLIGTGHVTQGAICGVDGSLWAASAGFDVRPLPDAPTNVGCFVFVEPETRSDAACSHSRRFPPRRSRKSWRAWTTPPSCRRAACTWEAPSTCSSSPTTAWSRGRRCVFVASRETQRRRRSRDIEKKPLPKPTPHLLTDLRSKNLSLCGPNDRATSACSCARPRRASSSEHTTRTSKAGTATRAWGTWRITSSTTACEKFCSFFSRGRSAGRARALWGDASDASDTRDERMR